MHVDSRCDPRGNELASNRHEQVVTGGDRWSLQRQLHLNHLQLQPLTCHAALLSRAA